MVSARSAGRLLICAVVAERAAEMVLSARHRRWALRSGGVERGAGHYPAMVAVHAALLVGCAQRMRQEQESPAPPALAWPMIALVLATQALRWWCVAVLGRQWNTRIIVIPGAHRCRSGPYRWLTHPNYLAVAVEGAALPLAVGARSVAAAFTVANAAVLAVRVRAENRALEALSGTGRGCSTC